MGNYLSNYYYGAPAAATASEPKPDFQETPAKSDAQVNVTEVKSSEVQVSDKQEVKSEVQTEVKPSESKSEAQVSVAEVKSSEVKSEVQTEIKSEQKVTIDLPATESSQPIQVKPAEPQARHKSNKRR